MWYTCIHYTYDNARSEDNVEGHTQRACFRAGGPQETLTSQSNQGVPSNHVVAVGNSFTIRSLASQLCLVLLSCCCNNMAYAFICLVCVHIQIDVHVYACWQVLLRMYIYVCVLHIYIYIVQYRVYIHIYIYIYIYISVRVVDYTSVFVCMC